MRRVHLTLCFMTATFLTATVAQSSPVLTFCDCGGGNAIHINETVGWQFTVNTDIMVTGLGWWDETGMGIPLAHMVAIWNSDGLMVEGAMATIPKGAGAPLDGQFRTVNLPKPVMLMPGTYIVGGQEFANDTERLACGMGVACDDTLNIMTIAAIKFVNGTFSSGTGFEDPTNLTAATQGLFGPSFSVAPEPGTIVMVLIGFAILVTYGKLHGMTTNAKSGRRST